MRISFVMLGHMAYGGLAQHSAILVKHLRELGCDVLPLVGLAPPHNDEVSLTELDYTFDAFNVADYVLRDKPALLRWLVGWYARHQVANGNPQKLRSTSMPALDIDYKRVVEDLFSKPDDSDLQKVDRKRRQFRPDVDYVCELSVASYFSWLTNLSIPLVVAAQGYEVSQRHGFDVISAIRRNERLIDTVISGSHTNVQENISRDLPFLLSRTKVIHYGVVDDENYAMSLEQAQARSQQFVRPSDEYVIMALSRIDVEKGTDLALHALRILLNQGVNARLRLVGDAVAGGHFRQTIEEKIAMMDLGEKVDYIGFVESKADKVALLKTSNCFVAPFIKSEPFGLVYCEAMAAGLPVIAPDQGAGKEIITWDGRRAGLIYRNQDTGQMADSIKRLIDCPDEARALGTDGRRLVEEHFNARKMAQGFYDTFAEAIDRRRLGSKSFHQVRPPATEVLSGRKT
ncbi:MAG: glycosyltransferase family 4 protein [Chloroflexota bacterium]